MADDPLMVLETELADNAGAFMQHAPYGKYAPAPPAGPLSGTKLAVKDLFDVKGLKTGAGHPDWLAGAETAETSSSAVSALVGAGAAFCGKTLTDALAWSLNGENIHYGTPRNVRAPGRIPGGSSAGSAAAVAAQMAEIALGSDTGGSVRLPASYCGIWGLRTTHGAVPADRLVPLAPSYDTVGWFADTAARLQSAGKCLLPAGDHAFNTIIFAVDLFDRVVDEHRESLCAAAQNVISASGLASDERPLAGDALGDWRQVFAIAQSADVWQTHGAWVSTHNPTFDPGITARFKFAQSLTEETVSAAVAARAKIAEAMQRLVADGALIIVPGAASPPPPCGLTGSALDDVRGRALEILCPAGHAGLPQLALPALATGEGPLGLGLIGPAGSDSALLAFAAELESRLQPPRFGDGK